MRPVARLAKFRRQLDALRLAAGKLGGGLAHADVVQADVVDGLELARDGGNSLEELHRLADGHFEHVGDALAFVFDFQRLAVVAPAVADLAGDVHIGQKLHLDLDDAVALARLAAPALDVEREPARLVAAHPGVGGLGKQVADHVEDAGVGRRVGARGAPDGGLVDVHDLVDMLDAAERRPSAATAWWCLLMIVWSLGKASPE